MTYDLTIGQRTSEPDINEAGDTIVSTYVPRLEAPDAPAYPGSVASCHTNRICITFGAVGGLEDALKRHDADLARQLFRATDDQHLIPVTAALVMRLVGVAQLYLSSHKRAVARFEGNVSDANYARLLLLVWWSAYSLATFGDEAAIQIS